MTYAHDSLKIEAQPIPKSELSHCRTRDDATASMIPEHHIDGILDFVQRVVDMLGGEGVRRVRNPFDWRLEL